MDEATGEILAAVVTTNDCHDSEMLADVLDAKGAKAVIPPRKDAKIWQHGNCQKLPHRRDENLLYIRQYGRKKWKRDVGHHRRLIAETTMFRFKTIFGGNVRTRKFDN